MLIGNQCATEHHKPSTGILLDFDLATILYEYHLDLLIGIGRNAVLS